MEILAFRGDESRGEEIKNILESLGGYNDAGLIFTEERYIYYFKECNFYKRNVIKFDAISDVNLDDFIIYTVDEFKEKFKFNVGDSVRLEEFGKIYTITKMRWDYNDGEVMYEINGNWYRRCDDLYPAVVEKKRMTQDVPKSTRLIDNLDIVEIRANEVEIVLDSCYSVDLKDGKIRIIRTGKYPKFYHECYEIMDTPENKLIECSIYGYKAGKFSKFQQLLICRDAYWKIAGEEMELSKPWEPDWLDTNVPKHCIYYVGNKIKKQPMLEAHLILAFPTIEMRDTFYENFKDLIEDCKEFL